MSQMKLPSFSLILVLGKFSISFNSTTTVYSYSNAAVSELPNTKAG